MKTRSLLVPRLVEEESDQERSHREWAENYERVSRAADAGKLSGISNKDLWRAMNYASERARRELQKGWDGGKANADLARSLQTDADFFKIELRQRGAFK